MGGSLRGSRRRAGAPRNQIWTDDMVAERERTEFIEYIRSRGMRVTPERMALLEEVYRQHGHIDADQILDGLKATGRKVSRATVYRNLDLLVECGLVQRQRLAGSRLLYEHVHPGQKHDHLACRRCARVVEFVSPSIQAMANEICRAHGFAREGRQLQILGMCEGCAAAEAEEAASASSEREAASLSPREGGRGIEGERGDPMDSAVGG